MLGNLNGPKLPSVMKHNFSEVPNADIPRSSFDRSHGLKTTFDSGYLVPILVDLAYPGDTFHCSATTFARLSTPIVPLMDNVYADTFFFSVPIRLVWNNFRKFMGEQDNPADSVSFLIPQMPRPAAGYAIGSLSDYFGIPTGIAGAVSWTHSSLWHRAYNLIYNQWFRDENLQNSSVVDVDDGPDVDTDYPLLKRGKRHDYFTSCLPWPQKGTAVQIPLGTQAVVRGNATNLITGAQNPIRFLAAGGGSLTGGRTLRSSANGMAESTTALATGTDGDLYAANLYADLSTATAATINSLRQAFQVQKLYERDARGGTRLIEIVQSHFGVTSPDLRATRPEYLGGGTAPIVFNAIPQTSSTDVVSPQGHLAAAAGFEHHGVGFTKSFTEHCLVIGLISVRADLTYQQGLNKMFSYSTKLDMYWPVLSHIGEQSVLNKEIFLQGTVADELVFGYQERYAEMRYKPSQITGKFRSDAAGTLQIFHAAQDFAALPTLGATFITEDPPLARNQAVTTEPQILLDVYFKYICARPMPTYSVPGLIDHF